MTRSPNDGTTPNQVLSHQKLLTEINSAVSQFEPLLPITPGQRELLLLKFNWNIESLRNSFQEYADTNLFLLENGICPKNIVSVINKSECGVCCSKEKVVGLRCRHMACLNCWSEFLVAKFKSGECVLGCMEFGCNMLISNEMLGKFLEHPKLLFSYQKVVIDNFVNNSSSLTWCIKKCGKAVRGSSGDTVTCSCGSKFCFTCKIDSHLPATCQQLKLFNQRQFDSDRKSSNWILYYTKECPKCFIPIQKNGGCNQMRCTACRYSFCWICSQTHYGECKQFYRMELQSQLDLRHSSYGAQYISRFDKQKRCLKADQEELATRQFGSILVECRQVLMYSCIFGYFAERGAYSKALEDHQKNFEKAVKELSNSLRANKNTLDWRSSKLAKKCQNLQKSLLDYCAKGGKHSDMEGSKKKKSISVIEMIFRGLLYVMTPLFIFKVVIWLVEHFVKVY